MKANHEWAVGDRVMVLLDGQMVTGTVILQTAFRTTIRQDGDCCTHSFEPDDRSFLPANIKPLRFTYTSHDGKTEARQVLPIGAMYDTSTHCYMLQCWCLDRKEVCDFDMSKMMGDAA